MNREWLDFGGKWLDGKVQGLFDGRLDWEEEIRPEEGRKARWWQRRRTWAEGLADVHRGW